MELVSVDPAQIQQVLESITSLSSLIENAINSLISALACVCFWLGMNSWETVAK